jgi:hypothetical protein
MYDIAGKSVAAIRKRHRLSHPSLPFGQFFARPFGQSCRSLDELKSFLLRSRYVSEVGRLE